MSIQLFTRPECHLCDEAQDMLSALGIIDQVEVVDIEADLQLIRRYGDKVPVLRWDNGSELCWPFSAGQIQQQQAEQ